MFAFAFRFDSIPVGTEYMNVTVMVDIAMKPYVVKVRLFHAQMLALSCRE